MTIQQPADPASDTPRDAPGTLSFGAGHGMGDGASARSARRRRGDERGRADGGENSAGRGGKGGGVRPGRRRCVWRVLLWLLGVLLLLLTLTLGALFGAVHDERGTRLLWQATVHALGGRLSGRFEGGALQTGVHLSQVGWRSGGATIRIDRIDGQWRLTRGPWRFTLDYLRLGAVDARLAPSATPSQTSSLPHSLQLPLQLELREVRVKAIRLHQGASTTELDHLVFHGGSDGRHHQLTVDRLDTPYGAASATLTLDGARPFALKGDAGFSGKVGGNTTIHASARLSGSLQTLMADIDASGMQLAVSAHVEATPFAAVPLRVVSIAADHINPQVLSKGAPAADLSMRAELRPVSARSSGPGAVPAGASVAGAAPVGASTLGAVPASAASLAVAGSVSIVNAKPGPFDQQLLPLIDAHATVRLDATRQTVQGLQVRLVKQAVITGGGALNRGQGRFDLKVARLDLHALQASLRATDLGGPVNVTLGQSGQALSADLADGPGGVRMRVRVRLQPAQTLIDQIVLSAGQGRIEMSGALRKDAASNYSLKATLVDFDPLALSADPAGISSWATNEHPRAGSPGRTHARRFGGALSSAHAGAAAAATASAARLAAGAARATTTATTPVTAAAAATTATAATLATAATAAAATTTATTGAPSARARAAAFGGRPQARISGKFEATGSLAPQLATRLTFALRDSVYDGLPLTGTGSLQLLGKRLLPSTADLSIAGNHVGLHGSLGAPADRLRFVVDAPTLARLGFGVSGALVAHGDLTGSLAHPNVLADYHGAALAFAGNRIGRAEGRAEMRDGPNGALQIALNARDVRSDGVALDTARIAVDGTRAKHTASAVLKGTLHGRPVDLTLAARGRLSDTRAGTAWNGTVTRLENQGLPALRLQAPLTVSAASGRLTLGATRLTLEGATLDLQALAYNQGRISSMGRARGISVARLLALRQEITGRAASARSDLVLDADWNFAVGARASGYAQLQRRGGDISVDAGRGVAAVGLTELDARADFTGRNRLNATVRARAARLGSVDADLHLLLNERNGVLTVADEAPLAGSVHARLPSLKTTGGLLGPSYMLDGRLAFDLSVAGQVGRPMLSGTLNGDDLSATLIDQGVQLERGVVRVTLSNNLVAFRQVEFHGASGTLIATGQIKLGQADPDLTARIAADKLELFASPDRQLSLSGQATVAGGGPGGGIVIDGKFVVDHALFDLPESAAPSLGCDVVVVRADGTVATDKPSRTSAAEKPAGPFAPRATVSVDLGKRFRFRGDGADLGLAGTITATSNPNEPLRAVGNVHVTQGSTYSAFGRKLAIEDGFFTFNGPVDNPGINILAMRRHQEVEAGVRVTGTVKNLHAQLVSEPNVPDNEKLTWLLFGHGTDQGTNLGQQSTMGAALALLGNAGGKHLAQTIGLDEVSVGQSEVGLTDPQVVMVSKAINERLVLGYEQGLTSAASVFKVTLNLSRFWSVAMHTGTFNGLDLMFNRRFDGRRDETKKADKSG